MLLSTLKLLMPGHIHLLLYCAAEHLECLGTYIYYYTVLREHLECLGTYIYYYTVLLSTLKLLMPGHMHSLLYCAAEHLEAVNAWAHTFTTILCC